MPIYFYTKNVLDNQNHVRKDYTSYEYIQKQYTQIEDYPGQRNIDSGHCQCLSQRKKYARHGSIKDVYFHLRNKRPVRSYFIIRILSYSVRRKERRRRVVELIYIIQRAFPSLRVLYVLCILIYEYMKKKLSPHSIIHHIIHIRAIYNLRLHLQGMKYYSATMHYDEHLQKRKRTFTLLYIYLYYVHIYMYTKQTEGLSHCVFYCK